MGTVSPIRRPNALQMECLKCGAGTTAACDCGVDYVPAGTRAAAAIAANPEKSDRVIAAELGVGNKTVSRARNKSTVSGDTVQKRTGKDGKTRKLPEAKAKLAAQFFASDPIQEACTDCENPAEFWERSLGNLAGDAISMRAFWSRQFGEWETFDVPSPLVTLTRQAAKAWADLATELGGQNTANELDQWPMAKRKGITAIELRHAEIERLPEAKPSAAITDREPKFGEFKRLDGQIKTACDYNPEDPADVAEPGDTKEEIRHRIFVHHYSEALRHAHAIETLMLKAAASEITTDITEGASKAAEAWLIVLKIMKRLTAIERKYRRR